MSRDIVIITGGGTGIGRGLVHHFSQDHCVITCGRRIECLEEARASAPNPSSVTIVQCDIATREGRTKLLESIPNDQQAKHYNLKLLVQNAAIGDPDTVADLNIEHFETALRVNVVAPLALAQSLLPRLREGRGRILHLGTSVAFRPQRGTATYGITKMAFHRLYQQLNAEGTGVPVASLSPGMVDTEGVRDHVTKARALSLPHVQWFDQAFAESSTMPMETVVDFVCHLLTLDDEEWSCREWKTSEWAKLQALGGKSRVGGAISLFSNNWVASMLVIIGSATLLLAKRATSRR